MYVMIALLAGAYLVGSVPSAVWIGRMVAGVDVREHGSKNAGATNVMRVLGLRIGIPVLLLDAAKGFASVQLALFARGFFPEGAGSLVSLQIALGGCAVLGHMFPIWAGFRGGKGVATLLGVILALHFPASMLALAVFAVVLILSKYVSLSSICAAISFPITVLFLFGETRLPMQLFAVVACLLLIYTHRKNIARLRAGTESKATFLFGSGKSAGDTPNQRAGDNSCSKN